MNAILGFSALGRANRYSALALLAIGMTACRDAEQKPISAPRERSQVIAAASGAASPRAASSAANATSQVIAKPRRALCEGSRPEAKALPKKHMSQAAASGARPLKENLSADPGSWTWVNFWAAWCAPCKEEIPRLLAWQQKLENNAPRLRVSFVSLDDDERQLMQFLDSSSSLRSTYWLKEGREREDWMNAVGLDPDPELPLHLLLDPEGKIRCRVQGAVEDSDYEGLARLIGG